jgi:hypothetical protein
MIPRDFPRRSILSSLSGAAPKLAVRRTADGTYTNLVSDEEHLERYEIAEDLAQQMLRYVLRKEREDPPRTREYSLQRAKDGMEAKFKAGLWDIVPAEQVWIIRRVTELLEAPQIPTAPS